LPLGLVLISTLLPSTGCLDTVTRPEPDLSNQDVRVTFLHTSDIHSRIFPYKFVPNRFDMDLGLNPLKPDGTTNTFGGIARMATIINRERAAASRSLHLDSGDIFEGAPIFNLFAGEAEMRAFSYLGVDAMVIGNHEFDKGAVNLTQQYQAWGGFPLLAANYIFADPNSPQEPGSNKLADLVVPYTIVNLNGVKIGVIGMGNVSSLFSIVEGGNSLGIRALDGTQVVQYYSKLLRPQVDLVVVLSHLGLDEDEGVAANQVADENDALASLDVDLILGGHLHIVLNPPKQVPQTDPQTGQLNGRTTVVSHSGAFAKFVGRLDVVVGVGDRKSFDPEKQRSRIKAFTYDVIPIDDTVPPDGNMANLLEPYELKLNRTFDLTRAFAYVNSPDLIRRNDPSGGDSQLGNLVAASMRFRRRVEADFALTNSLGIRADFNQGALTIEDMFNVFPFENSITTMFLSGSEVQEMLDFVAQRSGERGCRTQAQVSGLWFVMNCVAQNPRTGRTGAGERIYIGDNCLPCLSDDPTVNANCPDHEINGQPASCRPLDEFGSYRVAVNDFIAAGGSGFEVLKRNTTKFNTGISLRDGLVDYIQDLPGPCPNIDPKYGNVACLDQNVEAHDGRITAVSTQ
jgi:5'-nucleotidase